MIFRRIAAVFAPNPKRSVTTMLSIILLGMLLITIVSYIHTRNTAKNLAVGQAMQVLQFLNREINTQFLALRLNLQQWSHEDVFKIALENSYLGRSARKAAEQRLAERAKGRNIERILLVSADGEVQASSVPEMVGTLHLADRDYFKRSMAGETTIASLAESRYSGRPVIIVSGPIVSNDGMVIGVLLITLDTLGFAEKIIDDIHFGDTGGAYFIDLQTGVRAVPSWGKPGQFDPGTSFDAVLAAADTNRVIRYEGLSTERMAVSTINTESGWLLIVEADTSEILSPATRLATFNTMITLFILGVTILSLGALRRAMVDLKTSESQFRSLIETSPLGIATFDSQGHLTYMNTRTRNILSLSPNSLDQDWMQTLEDESGTPIPHQSLPMMQALTSKQSIMGWTAWRKMPYDIRQVLSFNAACLGAEHGASVVAVIEDITEVELARKILEQSKEELEKIVESRTKELREANARLLELDEMKSQFLSIVSHDLRTPLTSVLGFAKIIGREFAKKFSPLAQSDARLSKSAKRIELNLGIIDSEGKRLARLIDDLLDLSRIESGRYQWKDTNIDIIQLSKEASNALSAAFHAKPMVRLKLNLPDKEIPLVMDPDRVMQILINLLSNALKFTEQGEVSLTVKEDGDMLHISVSDTGIGIAPEDASRIFERFYQVGNPKLVSKPVGAGLGLSICKNIVTHYSGTISVESEPDKGSTFIVEFPLAVVTQQRPVDDVQSQDVETSHT
ncbi:ATP-binding protein [Desulfovibrio inopinatus]|uniref:ATP-binding protein n=1 Tax=Desulfovibrio inopinatus TaxID=102109 RepID=UPI000413D8DD|nr:ATP-binding protein [Desulfovibrio inopinatus]